MNWLKKQLKNWLLIHNFSFIKRQKQLCLLLFLFFTLINKAQITNYVSNGSFEDTIPNFYQSSFNAAKYWNSIDTNKNGYLLFSTIPYIGSAPYCGTGFQFPRSGNNFIVSQLFCEGPVCSATTERGYPRNRLKQTLQAGKTYCAKYYVVNTNNNRVAIEKYGMYFSDNSIDTINYCNIPLIYLTPQVEYSSGVITDTLNWIPITGTFVANGSEKYMVIGNFRSNATTNTLQLNTPLATQSADIYIDDVSVIDIDLPAFASPDIWGIPTNTVYLGRPQDVGIDEACMWYKLPNTTTAIDTAAGITVTVGIVTNTYVVRQEICGNVKWDTVVVHASGLGFVTLSGVEATKLKLFPNPANEILTVEFVTSSSEAYRDVYIQIINSFGQIVKEEELQFTQQTESLAATINIKEFANGVYVLKLSSRGMRDLNTDSSLGRNDNSLNVSKRFVISR
ncbi:MAG: T9SS type A sorting domain-containing protein [Bacteroidota bacterium]|nr:T9SS type A sorting domain-containing protein [Bacteroidota bacterium]